jgi:hypothetical protein
VVAVTRKGSAGSVNRFPGHSRTFPGKELAHGKENSMTRNLPSLRSIATDPGVLRGLSLDALDALLTEAEAENKIISAAKRAITGHVEKTYEPHIAAAYAASDKDFGTVRVSDGGYEIVVDTPKKVEWDQEKLADIRSRIQSAGDDPAEYLKATLAVDERAYTAWPAHIRSIFEPARTVKPGSRTVKLVRKEAA